MPSVCNRSYAGWPSALLCLSLLLLVACTSSAQLELEQQERNAQIDSWQPSFQFILEDGTPVYGLGLQVFNQAGLAYPHNLAQMVDASGTTQVRLYSQALGSNFPFEAVAYVQEPWENSARITGLPIRVPVGKVLLHEGQDGAKSIPIVVTPPFLVRGNFNLQDGEEQGELKIYSQVASRVFGKTWDFSWGYGAPGYQLPRNGDFALALPESEYYYLSFSKGSLSTGRYIRRDGKSEVDLGDLEFSESESLICNIIEDEEATSLKGNPEKLYVQKSGDPIAERVSRPWSRETPETLSISPTYFRPTRYFSPASVSEWITQEIVDGAGGQMALQLRALPFGKVKADLSELDDERIENQNPGKVLLYCKALEGPLASAEFYLPTKRSESAKFDLASGRYLFRAMHRSEDHCIALSEAIELRVAEDSENALAFEPLKCGKLRLGVSKIPSDMGALAQHIGIRFLPTLAIGKLGYPDSDYSARTNNPYKSSSRYWIPAGEQYRVRVSVTRGGMVSHKDIDLPLLQDGETKTVNFDAVVDQLWNGLDEPIKQRSTLSR